MHSAFIAVTGPNESTLGVTKTMCCICDAVANIKIPIHCTKTTSMENVSTRVLEKIKNNI